MSSIPTLGLRDYAARYGMILDEAYALMEHLRASNPQLPQHAPPDLPPTLEGISVYLGVSRGSEVSGLQPWQLEGAFLSVHAVIGFPLALAYLCAVVFFYARGGRFRWLEAAGRMALSNYLAQSLCFTAVLYPYGLNLTE